MTSYATSSFAQYQIDVCEPPVEIKADKICPTCVIDPNYIEPKWWLQTEPYLNKKTCEYSIAVTINEQGDYYTPALFRQRNETIKQVLRSFVRPAVRKILSFYGKQISDDIVCAIPPSGKNNTCRSLSSLGIDESIMANFLNVSQNFTEDDKLFNTHVFDSAIQNSFPQIKNLDAVELYARATDYHFGKSVAMPMKVLVSIPAEIVDAVPDVEETEDASFEEVTISGDRAEELFKTLSKTMGIFYKFQSIFYHEEGGNVFLKSESGEQRGVFYLTSFEKSVMKVYTKLQSILKDNGYKLGLLDSPKRPYEIKIIFDSKNPENPFNVKTIKARFEGCPFRRLKRQSVNSFNNRVKKLPYNRILMGYIANINNAHDDITARETIGWIDFLEKYTYLGISVDYGKYDPDAESAISCIAPDSIGLRKAVDFFLGEDFSLIDSIEYSFNKNNCKTFTDAEDQSAINAIGKDRESQRELRKNARNARKYTRQESRDQKKFIRDQDFPTELDRALLSAERRGTRDTIKDKRFHPYYDFAKDAALKEFDYENSLLRAFREADIDLDSLRDKSNAPFSQLINPCNWGSVSKKALRCLFAGLTLDEALERIAQASLEAMSPIHLGKLFVGLPVETQLEIQEEIQKQFKDVPYPWDTDYDPGTKFEHGEVSQPPPTPEKNKYASKIDKLNELRAELSSLETREVVLSSQVQTLKLEVGGLEMQIDALRLEAQAALGTPEATSLLRDLSDLNSELDRKRGTFTTLNDSLKEVREDINRVKVRIEKKKENIPTEELQASDTQQTEQTWDNLTEQQKQSAIDEQKDAAASKTKEKPYQAGSIGKAVGNIQKLVFDTYVRLILEKVGAEELLSYVDKLPGSQLLSFVIASYDCPRPGRFQPPIDSFLQTLTLDPCAGAVSIDLPKLQSIPKINKKDILKFLLDAFLDVLEAIIAQAIQAIILKTLETLESAICKSIGQVGNVLISGVPDGGLLSVIQQELCSEPLDESEAAKVGGNLLKDLGITPNDYRQGLNANDMVGTYESIAKALGVLATSNEIKSAMVSSKSEQNQEFLEGVSNALTTMFPDFSIAFDSPEKVGTIFGTMGNYLTPEQRVAIRDTIRDGDGDFPINPSVCLTNEQRELWDEERRALFEEAGLSPEDAQDWVDKQNDRSKSDFYDIAKGIADEDSLGGRLNDALRISDPDCDTRSSAIKLEDETLGRLKDNITETMFSNMASAFTKDIIAGGLGIGRFNLGSPGAIQFILKSKKGKNFSKIKDFETEAPETVAIQMWKNLIQYSGNEKLEYQKTTGPRKSEVAFEYYDSTHEDVKSYYLKFKYYASLYRDKKKLKTLDYRLQIKSAPVVGGLTPLEGAAVGAAVGTAAGFGVFAPITATAGAIVGAAVAALDEAEVSRDEFETFNFRFNKAYPRELQRLINEHDITQSELDSLNIQYQSRLFTNYLNSALSPMGGTLDPSTAHDKIYGHLNDLLFNDYFKKLFLNRKDKRALGFNYGYNEASKITFNDLLYVNPDADPDDQSTWKYTFDNADGVLGKSATENPRVKFLDPVIHGGSYKTPKVYIERAQHGGWMSLAQALIPEIDGCKPRKSGFLNFDEIVDRIRDVEKKSPFMKELSYDPECVIELPFKKIAAPSTQGYLDGIVMATIRVFVSEFIIKGYPIFSNVKMSNNNFDDLAQFIVQRMESELSDMAPIVPIVKIQREAYWLLFLEQAVESLQRKLNNEEIEYNEEIEEATQVIRRLQKNYEQPNFKPDVVGLAKFNTDPDSLSDIQRQIIDGALICGFAKERRRVESVRIKARLFTLENARFAHKIAAINSVRGQCETLLKYLVQEQLEIYKDRLDESLPVMPRIHDTKKYFIGGSDVFFGPELNAGLTSVEDPRTGGQSNIPYGNVFHVSRDVNTHNPLDGHIHKVGKFEDPDEPHIRKGGLILEKYLRIVDKKPTLFASEKVIPPPAYVSQRSDNLKEIVNIKEFQQFLKDNSDKFGEGDYISSVLGDAAIVFDEDGQPTGYKGSVGIKYGVRVSYVAPGGISPFAGTISDEQKKVAQENKAFKLKRGDVTIESENGSQTDISLQGSTFIIPLVSYEKDVLDRRLKDLDLEDDDFGEDLKCQIDNLAETDEFKFLFDICLPVNRASFLASFYSYNTLISSIFKDPSEFEISAEQVEQESEELVSEEEDPDMPISDDLFKRSKEEARSMFRAFYQREDAEVEDDMQQTEDSNYNRTIRGLIPSAFINIDTNFLTRPKWWQLRRIKERPFDKDGNECQSVYQRIFEED